MPEDFVSLRKRAAFARWLLLAAGIAALDQWSKGAILARFFYGERVVVTEFFNLVLVWNPGASFSLLAGAGGWQRWFFIALAVLVSLWILRVLWATPERRLQSAALSAILGGALGNVMDRFRHGAVVDFLDVHLADWHWPAFNVADCAVTLGAALFILCAWREDGAERNGNVS
ncbi:MAG: signal peptidase II [Zoogloeaceae bacterium]|jgi:signal peptidase II|nr:signal peptidase II [Zoogloeaceae bacterium]